LSATTVLALLDPSEIWQYIPSNNQGLLTQRQCVTSQKNGSFIHTTVKTSYL